MAWHGLLRTLPFVLMLSSACTAVGQGSRTSDGTSPSRSEPERQIEIAIRDHAYVMIKPTPIRMGTPAVITLRNEDAVTHGFISPMFVGLPVQMEGEGIAVQTKEAGGFHVDPGKTIIIRFTPDRLGTLSFQCDLHPEMKERELLYLDIRPSRHR